MPTIITHAAIPLAIGLGQGSGIIGRRLLLAGVAASILPDMDVLACHIGSHTRMHWDTAASATRC